MFNSKTKVILDTNALLLPSKGVDIFSEIDKVLQEPYTVCTFQGVLDELEKLMLERSDRGFSAKLGFILTKQKALKTLPSSKGLHIDDVIVAKTDGLKHIVVTQDAQLIKRLIKRGIRVLRYQQKRFIFQ